MIRGVHTETYREKLRLAWFALDEKTHQGKHFATKGVRTPE